MNLKILLTLICSLTVGTALFAQDTYTLSGTVTSSADGTPIFGANVVVLETSRGTTTDFDGKYQIAVRNGDRLQFSYLGYTSQTTLITGQTELNMALNEDANQLDEVIVVGYGTQRKSHLTGSISKVVNDDLDQIAVSRVDDALVGQVSGVNIQATEGEAGSAPTIRIRGTGSISGSSSPLIVVDGLVVDNDFLGNLDMNDVESFEVLKDAASSAIYGSRGANGVIIVTTKQGKEGETKFSYGTFYGFKEARQSDAYYFSVAETAAAELAATGQLSERTQYMQLLGVDRDWQDVIFNGGVIESHSFAARGGSERTRFSTALNYVHDEGVLLTDDYKKYNFKLRLETKMNDKFSYGLNLSPSYSNKRRFDGSTHDILRQAPWLPLYHDAHTVQFIDRNVYPDVQIGDYALQRHFDNYDLFGDGSSLVDISDTSNTNPAAKVLERDRNEYKFKVYGGFFGRYKITDNLSFRASLAGDFQNTKRDRWQGVRSNRNGASAASLDISSSNRIHFASDNYFSYDKIIGDHELSTVLGFSAEKYDTSFESVSGSGYDSDLIQTISAATIINEGSSIEYQQRLMSFFGRVNYAFDNRYLVSLSLRRDGFSVFGPENKYGNFPAAAVGWNISNEAFLEDSNIINNLKFRFSYGVTGNPLLDTGDNLIDNYPYIALLNATTAVVNNGPASGFTAINIANPDLQWERSIEI
ncbi:MAG: SusC/RagA family TonB-linked outer membrane protein, partial [Marinirhabdus sp.]